MELKNNERGVIYFRYSSFGRAVVVIRLLLFASLFIFFFSSFVSAVDEYKPYLHKASVPEHPKMKLYGSYATNLFPGAATYSYPLELPQGTNNLQPSLTLFYNSQNVKGNPAVLGAGWSITENYVYRDINFSLSDTSDDKFRLVLGGSVYDLVYDSVDTYYHTKIESYLRIVNYSTYWIVTSRDGTQYRFGYNSDSKLEGNNGQGVDLRWSLDQVEDTHGNKIYYTYLENPYSGDNGAVYISSIAYNNDQKRKINFTYESSDRPDGRLVYEQGNEVNLTRRLSEINIYFDDALIRKYEIKYVDLNSEGSLTSISNITYYGSDGSSVLHRIYFDYYESEIGYGKDTTLWKPPVLFSNEYTVDYGVRLADLNKDGFVDFLRGREGSSEKNIWINNRSSGWEESPHWSLPIYFVSSSNYDNGVRLVDFDKDGFTDLLQGTQVGGNTKDAWRNNGTGFVDFSNMDSPIYFTDSSGRDFGARFGDIDGDGYIDIIQANEIGGTNKKVYKNNKSAGWVDVTSDWTFPTIFIDSSYNDKGVRLIDFNADGLVDILEASNLGSSIQKAWINSDHGWTEVSSTWAPPVYFTTTAKIDNGVRLADINGDGLVDILEDFANGTETSSSAYINTGHGWTSSSSWKSPEAFTKDGNNIGRRIADVNGDGFGDILVAYGNNSVDYQYAWTKNETTAYLLKSITNEFGGFTNISYVDSTSFNNTGNDSLSDVGFNIDVVEQVEQNNSMNDSFNVFSIVNYSYFGGMYDYKLSEFRGFSMVNETRADNTLVNHYFYQDDILKGKEYITEIFDDSNNPYSKEEKRYRPVPNSSGYDYIFVDSVLSYTYDGAVSNPDVVNVSYLYNENGDVVEKYYHGDVGINGDEKEEDYDYWYNSTNWIMGKVKSYSLFDDSTLVKYTVYSYDDRVNGGPLDKGELTMVWYWNNNGSDPIIRYDYDAYGHKISEIDALGRETEYVYGLRDDTYTYADRVVNTLDHYTDYSYDVGAGNLEWEEKNHIRKSYFYDVFGRIVKEVLPYDSYGSPTVSYTYSFDGVAPEKVMVSKRNNLNETMDTYYFYDGFSSLLQVRSSSDNGNQVVKDLFYDGMGRVESESNPYLANFSSSLAGPSSSFYTNYTYDALGRVVNVRNPDDTNKSVVFERYNVTTFDENSHKKAYVLDAFGRIVHVYEYNNEPLLNDNNLFMYNTTYSYDAMDNLVLIEDTKGNNFEFSFDSLGRKVSMDDPDLGEWKYYYDKAGNLIRQVDARGYEINLTYDSLNRVLRKAGNGTFVEFTYDEQYFGTLSTVSDGTVEYNYTYDKRYRITKEEAKLGGSWLDTSFTYDSMDRILSEALDGVGAVGYDYDYQGLVDRVPGFVNGTSYNAFGNPLNRSLPNNLRMEFSYNSSNGRLIEIKTGSLQDLDYNYDAVGNVVGINDTVNNRKQSMTYDYLDRLVNASINDSHYRYVYDELGNMLKIIKDYNSTTRLIYGGEKAHAHYSVVTGNAGVMVYNVKELNKLNKNKTFEFFLVNEKNDTINNVSWNVDWGDGNSDKSLIGINLSESEYLRIIVGHSYNNSGDYDVNVTASWGNYTDSLEVLDVQFGVKAAALNLLNQNITNVTLEFKVENDVEESASSINWSCDNGLSSDIAFNLSGNETIFIIIGSNYSTPGYKTLRCNANSTNGNDFKATEFKIRDVEIEDYNSTVVAGDKKILNFLLKNYFSTQNVNWEIKADGQTYSGSLSVGGGNSSVVSQQVNFSFPGIKAVTINVSTDYSTDNVTDHFNLKGIEIENYLHVNKTYSDRIFSYTVKNHWADNFTLKWNMTDPNITSEDETVLNYNDTLFVFIEENFTTTADWNPTFFIYNSTNFNATFTDRIALKLLEIISSNVLYQNVANTIVEMVVRNNMESLNAGWSFDTDEENITSTQTIGLNNSQEVFIFVGFNYTSLGTYATEGFVNSSVYNDTITGAVVA